MEMAALLELAKNSSAETYLHVLKDGKAVSSFWPV